MTVGKAINILKVKININVPKINKDKLFLNKEGMITKQIKEALFLGQVIEIII